MRGVIDGGQDAKVSPARGEASRAAIAWRNEPAETSCSVDRKANAAKKGNCLSCIMEYGLG